MKKDFVQLVKELRVAFRPEFLSIVTDSNASQDKFNELIASLEEKRNKMIEENGYSISEFDTLSRDYSFDFSSENPEEWKIEKLEVPESA